MLSLFDYLIYLESNNNLKTDISIIVATVSPILVIDLCHTNVGRLQRPTGVLQAVAAEETGAAAARAAAGGDEETRAGRRLPPTQPRGV